MSSRLALLLALGLCACGDYSKTPAFSFKAQLVSPASSDEFDLSQGGTLLSAASATCSISDPVLAVSVAAGGCSQWGTFLTRGANRSDPLPNEFDESINWTGDAVGHVATGRLSIVDAFADDLAGEQDFTKELGVAVRCTADDPGMAGHQGPTMVIPMGLAIDGYQGEKVDTEVRALAPLGNGDVLAIGDGQLQQISFSGAGGSLALPGVGATPQVRTFDDVSTIVANPPECLWPCQDLEHELAAVTRTGTGGLSVGRTTLQSWAWIERLRPGRLALLLPDLSSIEFTDYDFSNPKVVDAAPLPTEPDRWPGSPPVRLWTGRTADGSLAFIDQSQPGRLGLVTVSQQEEVSRKDIGPAPGDGSQALNIWIAPDASYYVYQLAPQPITSPPNTCTLAVRDLTTQQDRFTATEPCSAVWAFLPNGLFMQGQSAIDPSSGHHAWSLLLSNYGFYSNFYGSIESASVVSDALVLRDVTNGFLHVLVYGADGEPRLAARDLPLGNSRGPVQSASFLEPVAVAADSAGNLFGAVGGEVFRIQAADAGLHARPTVCSRVDCGLGETDLATDPDNCGECFSQCQSGRCFFGECLPETED